MFPSVFARLPIEKTFLPGSRDVAADLTFVHVGKRCLHSAEPATARCAAVYLGHLFEEFRGEFARVVAC